MTRVTLIDNYDSFTWNLYEYLRREGAEVTVHRNDAITTAEIEKENPDIIMISPGPGHPDTDTGISIPTIKKFEGKVPIFGVCMGMQCIVRAYGGDITYAGEIVHGKTSPMKHEDKGAFKGLPQGTQATRYHSLAAHRDTLPEALEVTAISPSSTIKEGVIQGVRHRTFTIEGIQFHPESIMSEDGRQMIRNILSYRGGKWDDASRHGVGSPQATSTKNGTGPSILDKIFDERKRQVAIDAARPGCSFEAFQQALDLGLAPPLVDFVSRLRSQNMSLIAEVKRASPSRGDIAKDAHAASQGLIYARAGASAISVLTEPHWFKGSIEDLRQVRLAVDGVENRPAVLRKEFIFDKYQILEARLYGADTVLLIVKMLDDDLLKELYDYSVSLGMEPLVEVSNGPEMERALTLRAKVIGVNNRDLHSFAVDMGTTSSIAKSRPEGTVLLALSGIQHRTQVEEYAAQGVGGILVGESLMRSSDPGLFVKELVGA